MTLREILAGALAALTVMAQTPAPTPPKDVHAAPASGEVILRSTTRLVQVNVVVHDHKGPVADLKKEDFQIKEDGKPQTIALFSVESKGALPGAANAQQKLPPNVFTNELTQRPGVPSSVTIILLDTLNTRWTDQIYAKQQVVKFLQTIQPTDRVGIYTLGAGLRVLHDFTTDSSSLLKALDRFKGQNLPDLAASEGEPMAMSTEAVELNNWFGGRGSSGAERDFYTINRVKGTLATIEFIANHLATLPGRKNLIWVSGGFPLDIGFDSLAAWHDPSREQYAFTEEMSRAMRAVNNANLAIYPVDARGLMTDNRFSAENQKVDLHPRLSPGPGVKNQQTMQELASRTGGRAYYNTNDLKTAIRDAIADSDVTYTIGYYPTNEAFDGKFHKIDVKVVDRGGLNLRYRKGYFDEPSAPQDPKQRMVDLKDAVFSPIDASGVGLVVGVRPNAQDRSKLDIAVKVDQKSISLEPQGEHWQGRLDLLFVQKNDQGKQFNGVEDTMELNLTRANYDILTKQGLIYQKQVSLAPQAKMLRVVVRDAASGNLGSVTVPFDQITN